MSRLTASSFHQQPASFEFPARAPLSSPVTSSDPIVPSLMPSTISVAGMQNIHNIDSDSPILGLETPGARNRRVSSLAYHSSGIRESRERIPQRNFKSFVVVIPPPSLLQEHGQLGHTLSLGPRHRLSQGLLMPLFPTLYGQLTAIAREFNFPSTTGLCVYLHYSSDDITLTPRVSDETWGLLWNHLLDGTPPSQKLPIGGKIEFDIDLRQARWYSAWLFPSQREPVDIPISSVPSTAAAHLRHESRTTSVEDRHPDSPSPRQPTTLMPRHVPRNLSLVDRLDTMTIRSIAKPRSLLTPPANKASTSQMLSPIHQVEEPKSANENLETRVKSWRASASLEPTPLAAKGQTSLEPANMPNNLTLDDGLMPTREEELKLEDFSWSVSSQGPGDYEPGSPLSCPRLPSIHIANRMEGSVCLTPTDCTSFGPSDYTLSPLSTASLLLPSPDIALRMLEEVPLTPSTATSWGPPSVYPPSPTSDFHAPSLDIGERHSFSRPVTPSTATSWGPVSWPPSPMSPVRPLSIHIADRNGDVSRPDTPSTATSWDASLSFPPSPPTPSYVATTDVGRRSLDSSEEEARLDGGRDVPEASMNGPWRHVWPYTCTELLAAANAPWRHVWPYNSVSIETSAPWKYVWPYNNPVASDDRTSTEAPWRHVWPYNARSDGPWKHVWPYNKHVEEHAVTRRLATSVEFKCFLYPNLVIYPAVYPKIASYTEVEKAIASDSVVISMSPPAVYPIFDLYPAVYPHNLSKIYHDVTVVERSVVNHVKPDTGVYYPVFNLYPPIYHHSTPYSPTIHVHSHERLGIEFQAETTIALFSKGRHTGLEIHPLISVEDQQEDESRAMLSVRCASTYPVFNLCSCHSETTVIGTHALPDPALYPFFEIYPSMHEGSISDKPTISGSSAPHAITEPDTVAQSEEQPISVLLEPSYPVFSLYPPIYPNFVLYPTLPEDIADLHNVYYSSPEVVYPTFWLYPAVYPRFDLYPKIQVTKEVNDYQVEVASIVEYPHFNLYPAVYPYFDLYPAVGPILEEVEPRGNGAVKSGQSSPSFEIYPAVYPHFDLYPSFKLSIRPLPNFSGLITQEPKTMQRPVRSSKTHHQLHEEVFATRPCSRKDGITDRSTQSSANRSLDYRASLRLRSAVQVGPPPTPPPIRGLPVRPLPVPESDPHFLSKGPLSVNRALQSRPDIHISYDNSLAETSTHRRSVSDISSSASVPREAPHLPSVGEDHTVYLNRSSSAMLPTKQKSDYDNVVHPLSSRPVTKKRDSLVLQRVRALNSAEECGSLGPGRIFSVPRVNRHGFA
ncbi:uncharacterized protein BT62DRAFT_992258 [Guyanagaster necrorhizus]|uniref:Uncharacterized protein n=1 Tax=Guyanagaster necrorhizus TaxID=856835 RepID=A0A9P7VZ27_9AGAR|nr:uncharacterized protein BT62DRAFT_992258 [Guyanagaster necrorhizus MCA 3950]KAG7449172.1 hypothetical protein BT62DRAFT_992258 [Guyanagaster necrorhizus MCA 3950]